MRYITNTVEPGTPPRARDSERRTVLQNLVKAQETWRFWTCIMLKLFTIHCGHVEVLCSCLILLLISYLMAFMQQPEQTGTPELPQSSVP